MGDNLQVGDRVIYTGTAGCPVDHERAYSAGLTVGYEYTVEAVSVGNWSTDIRLLGHPGWHNSVIFDKVGADLTVPSVVDSDTFYGEPLYDEPLVVDSNGDGICDECSGYDPSYDALIDEEEEDQTADMIVNVTINIGSIVVNRG